MSRTSETFLWAGHASGRSCNEEIRKADLKLLAKLDDIKKLAREL
jgi:hypothetical protein